jgi:hypothetical protein
MRRQIVINVTLATCFLASCQRASEHPEVAFRHCMRDQAVKLGKQPTFAEAQQFARNCDDLAIEAAKAAVSSGSAANLRDGKARVVESYVCAYSHDGTRCPQ